MFKQGKGRDGKEWEGMGRDGMGREGKGREGRGFNKIRIYLFFYSSHYGDNLDGCGLELEGKVRKTYYTFLRRLLDSVRSFTGDPNDERFAKIYKHPF